MVPQREIRLKPGQAKFLYDVLPKNEIRYGEANVAYVYGEIQKPCTNKCDNGQGRYPDCVTVTNAEGVKLFNGACTCCRAQDHGNRCSYYDSSEAKKVKKRKVGGDAGGNKVNKRRKGGNEHDEDERGGMGGEGIAGLPAGAFSAIPVPPSRPLILQPENSRSRPDPLPIYAASINHLSFDHPNSRWNTVPRARQESRQVLRGIGSGSDEAQDIIEEGSS